MAYNDEELLDRLANRRPGIDLSFGNPVIQRIGNTLSRMPHFGGPPRRNDDDLETKLALMNYRRELNQNPLDNELKQAQIDSLRAPVPTGFVRAGNRIEEDPTYKDPNKLTPGQELAKDKATKEIFETRQMNQAKGRLVDNAIEGSENVPSGLFGKMRIGAAKTFPFLGNMVGVDKNTIQDAQELKMALTMGSLAETAYTKGAISDQEMALFKEASANDDFNSPAIIPVLKKIKDYMNAEQSGQYGAYKKNYGEDPSSWFTDNPYNAMKPNQPSPAQNPSFYSPEEADNSGLAPGTVVMVNGRRYQIG